MAVCLFTHEAFVCPAEGEPLPYRGLLGFMANPFSAINYGLQQAECGGDNNSQKRAYGYLKRRMAEDFLYRVKFNF